MGLQKGKTNSGSFKKGSTIGILNRFKKDGYRNNTKEQLVAFLEK